MNLGLLASFDTRDIQASPLSAYGGKGHAPLEQWYDQSDVEELDEEEAVPLGRFGGSLSSHAECQGLQTWVDPADAATDDDADEVDSEEGLDEDSGDASAIGGTRSHSSVAHCSEYSSASAAESGAIARAFACSGAAKAEVAHAPALLPPGLLLDCVDTEHNDAMAASFEKTGLVCVATPVATSPPAERHTPNGDSLPGDVGTVLSWSRGELIGRGSLGSVWMGLIQRTGQMMAVKEVVIDGKDREDEKFRATIENEVCLYKGFSHPNIVAYLGNDFINDRLYIYLEYMPGGSISQVLEHFGALGEPLVAQYTRDVVLGLEYLHSRETPVLHRDIKGANILVGLDGTAKLSDFGCSKRSANTAVNTLRGSVPWMAPEVMLQKESGRKADIWSLGCVVVEMRTAAPPWGHFDNHLAAMLRIAMSNETPPLPADLSEACHAFAVLCTRRSPEERPDAAQLLHHAFLSSLERASSNAREGR